jgi:hypothetical protein
LQPAIELHAAMPSDSSDRLKETHVPGGWRPLGSQTYAIKGHELGLRLDALEREQLIAFLRTL